MREQLGGIFWLCIALFGIYEGWKCNVGHAGAPGPGFVPFWSAALLGAFSLAYIIFISVIQGKTGKLRDLWKGMHWGKILGVSIALVIYPLVFSALGYILDTCCLIFLVMVIMKPGRPWRYGLYASIISVLSFLIFNSLLDSRLPTGMLGF